MRIRQPLRKQFFSCKEWCGAFSKQGFSVKEITEHALRYSISNWAHSYDKTEKEQKYISLLKNAPEIYHSDYDVAISDDDIHTTAHCVKVVFINQTN